MVAYLPKVYMHNYYHGVIVIKKELSISAKVIKIEDLDQNQTRIYETYKNTVISHGRHIYAK